MNSQTGKNRGKKAKSSRTLRFGVLLVTVILFAAGVVLFWFYHMVTKPVIDLRGEKFTHFHIHTGSTFPAVVDSLTKTGYLTDPEAFRWLARKKHYDVRIRPGRYRLSDQMSNNALVNLLRSGRQEPVRVVVQNVNTQEELAGRIGRRLETDSSQLIVLFRDPSFLARFDVSPATLMSLFIPDTYEMYWSTSGEELFKKMQKEYQRFWTPRRRQDASMAGLTIPEVVTLASIVEKESNKRDERPIIAGVYLNRLKKGIALQADPTVIFAWKDYRIRRVTGVHTALKSPYNTYYRSGLPPGPICLPSVNSIDAVLQAKQHTYLFFCAREDLSGYHNFASTLDEHNRNARKYQKALNKLNIR